MTHIAWCLVGIAIGFVLGMYIERGRKLQKCFETIPVSEAAKGPAHAIAYNVLLYSYGEDLKITGTIQADRLDLGTAKDFAQWMEGME